MERVVPVSAWVLCEDMQSADMQCDGKVNWCLSFDPLAVILVIEITVVSGNGIVIVLCSAGEGRGQSSSLCAQTVLKTFCRFYAYLCVC